MGNLGDINSEKMKKFTKKGIFNDKPEKCNLCEIPDHIEVNDIFDFLNNKINVRCEFKNALTYYI